MEIPVSTYRLQLNATFTLNNVEHILSYLHDLGISTVYASPIFAATPGSMHGYDVCDPHTINPEIGTQEQLLKISNQLKQNNMTWLQDIVPNHMAFSLRNQRLADVLERGPSSTYYSWFDIDWQHPDPSLHSKLMVPVLGKPLMECLEDGDISLDINNEGFIIKYFSQEFPLSVNAYDMLLAELVDDPSAKTVNNLLQQLYTQATVHRSLLKWQQVKQPMIDALMINESTVVFVKALVAKINNNRQLLYDLLQQQYYQLTFWQDANRVIDYRRFFAVNELISLNIASEAVFYEYHSLLYNLYQQKVINGLRVDHIDGLNDPGTYLNRLRQFFGNDCYLVVEKILEQKEQLPSYWPIQGTTGYEFCSQVGWLLTNKEGAQKLVAFYKELFPDVKPYQEIVFEKKQFFLQNYMVGEWDNLVRHLYDQQLAPDGLNKEECKQALGLFMCCLPVYRLYPGEHPLDAESQEIITATFKDALQRKPGLKTALHFLESLWNADEKEGEQYKRRLTFLQRLMQFTGPLTAKGVEDTTFYVYNPLLGHNEVGDTPDMTDFSVNTFHEWMMQRQELYPHSLNATSTHDTKRGEDGRVRLFALSLFANDWKDHVLHWQQINKSCKSVFNNQPAPALQDEYFIYQSVLAGFPADAQITAEYIDRLKEYLIKSLREAKINSNWQVPVTAYEDACCDFIEKILSPQHTFLKNFTPFFETIEEQATILSLTQALIKITAPGVPDIYQGCELWDLSYVDPDNRRPVDYTVRKKYMQELINMEKKGIVDLLNHIVDKRKEGLEKLYVTWKALQCRNKLATLFLQGDYHPIYTTRECGIVAYARQYEQQWAIMAAPVSDAIIRGKEKELLSGICLSLPFDAPVNWKNELTGETITVQNNLPLDAVFNAFPVALLTGESNKENI